MAIANPSVVADFPTTSGGVGTTTTDCPAGSAIWLLPYPDNTNGTIVSVTDSVGNTYVEAVATATQTGQFTASIWYCLNCIHLPVGSTIHIVGVPTSIDMTVYYSTGANGGLDVTNSIVTNSNITTLSLATGTLAQAAEIIIGFVIAANSPSPPTASGFTNYDTAYGFFQIVNATTSVTFTPVWTGSAHAVAVIASFKATASGTNITMVQVGVVWRGTAAGVNQKTFFTVIQASWKWNGFAAGINQKLHFVASLVSCLWTGNVPPLNQKTEFAAPQAEWLWEGNPPVVSGTTVITGTQVAWKWNGQVVNINQKTAVILIQASWKWLGNSAALNMKTFITLTRGIWQWVGNPITGFSKAVQALLLLLGVGS